MDENLKKIVPYLKEYKINTVSNIIFNILYALFSALSFLNSHPLV